MKRPPLLADQLLMAPDTMRRLLGKQQTNIIINLLLEAKRFVLDEQAAQYMAELIRDAPEVVAQNQEFALKPFPVSYFEFPFPNFFRIITGADPDFDADKRVAYLYAGNHVYVLAGDEDDKEITMALPLRYRLNQPMTLKEELALVEAFGTSRAQLDYWFWGQSALRFQGDPDLMRTFRAHHGVDILPLPATMVAKPHQRFFLTSAGDLRNIIAMLVFINRAAPWTYEAAVPPQRAMLHNKPRTYLAHSVLSLKLNPVPRLKRLLGIGGAWRREHDVRGHFCHNEAGRSPTCDHEWLEHGVNQWHCALCGGLKWWRREHVRGHRDKGIVTSEYKVTE